jgi:hypothetical protein
MIYKKVSSVILILFVIAALIGPVLAITGGLNVAITPKIAEVSIGSSYTFNLTIISTQDVDDLLSINVTTDTLPDAWKANLSWFEWTFQEKELDARETLKLHCSVSIPDDVGEGDKAFKIIATSGQTGQVAYDTGILSLVESPQPIQPVLQVSSAELAVCLNPNESITTAFQVANVGDEMLENVRIVEPDVLWMDVITNTSLGDLMPGEDCTIEVQFNSYDEGVGNHYDSIEVLADNHPTVEVNVHADITTEPNGTVVFYVQDAYGRCLNGSDVTLVNQETFDVRTNITTETGVTTFVDVPKGDYTYYVYSPNPEHYPCLGTIYVPPTEGCIGCEYVNATLYESYIDFEWDVWQAPIMDKYFIMLNLTFETDIPVPILVAVPPRIDRIIEPCNESNDTLKLMNLGRIPLFNVTLSPIAMDNGLTIEFDRDFIEEIVPGPENAIEVNYTLRLNCSAPECQVFGGRVVAKGEYIHFNPFYTSRTIYSVDCGDTDTSPTPTDVAYDSTLGYGYLNGESSTAWGTEAHQSIRENDTVVRYRFDLEPDKIYQIELGFYDPTSSRNVSIYADGELLKADVELTDTPETITKKIEPQSIYADGSIILEIQKNSGESAVVSTIKVSELYKEQLKGVAGTYVPIRVHSDRCPTPPDFETPTWDFQIVYLPDGYTRVCFFNVGPCYFPTLFRGWGGVGGGGGGCIVTPISWSWSVGPSKPSVPSPLPVPEEPLPLPVEREEITVHEIVRLSISQTAIMELDALFAGLGMTNRMWNKSLEGIDVDINITDEWGNANDRFFIKIQRLMNINNIDGSGVLGPLQTGSIIWLIIPKRGAGGSDPAGKFYNVSADIGYTVDGETQLYRTQPVQVVVLPSANLTLDYYIPSDVKANQPFKLAVKVINVGYGPAKNFSIETAQPVIIDNLSGLLIDFEIVGSALNGVPRSNSLKVDFGDIGPNECRIAWWEMITTLDGEFTEFTGKFTHSSEFGGIETSRISDLQTHIIRRQVDTGALFYDFLVDSDKDFVPDWVVDSATGEAIDVLTVSYDVIRPPTVNDPVLEINVSKIEGKWIYIPITDPCNNEAPIVEVTRSDGKIIPAQNYWMQDGMIYIVDDPAETYEISYNLSAIAPHLWFEPPTPANMSVLNVDFVEINISSDKPLANATLEWNGTNMTMSGSNTSWHRNFTNMPDGDYTFKAYGTDLFGFSNNTEMRIVTISIGPAILSYSPSSPVNDTEGTTRVFSITVSEPVNVSWLINGTEVQTNTSVTEASYRNTSAPIGVWNVSAIAADANGTALQLWIWNVTPPQVISYKWSKTLYDVGCPGGHHSGGGSANLTLSSPYKVTLDKFCVDDRGFVEVNGVKVFDDTQTAPCCSAGCRALSLDITPFVHPGENTIYAYADDCCGGCAGASVELTVIEKVDVLTYSIYTDTSVTWEVMDVNTPIGIQRGNTIDVLKDGKPIVRLDAGMSGVYVYNISCSAYSYLGVYYRVCHDGPSYSPTQSEPKIDECGSKCVLSVNSSSNGGAITAHYTVTIYPNCSVYVDKIAEVPNSLCTDECGIEDGNIGLTLSLVEGTPCDGNTHVKVYDNNSWYGWDPTSCSGYGNIDTIHALDIGDQFSVNRLNATVEFFTEYTQGYDNNGQPSSLAAVVQHGPNSVRTIVGRKGLTMYSPTNLPAGSYLTRGWLRTYCCAENQQPFANFTYAPKNPIKGDEIIFNASSSYDLDGSIVSYEWNFGDGSNATGVVVNHTYSWIGNVTKKYNVTLNVTDDFGLTNTTTISLLVAAFHIDSIIVENADTVWNLTIHDTPDADYLVGEPGVMVTKYADTFSYLFLQNATAIERLHDEPGVMVTKYADTFSYLFLQNATAIERLHDEPGVMVTKYADTFSYLLLDNASAIGLLTGEPNVMVTTYADSFTLKGLTAPPFAP